MRGMDGWIPTMGLKNMRPQMSVYSLTQEDSGKAARTRRITMYQVNEDPESFRAAQYRDGPEAASVPKSGTDGEVQSSPG